MGPRKTKSTAHRRRSAHPSVDAGRALLEVFETLEEEFDEAAEHVRQRREFHAVRLSAVRPLSADRLAAGSVGWLREIRLGEAEGAGPDTPTGTADEVETLVGWLYFVVSPRREAAEPGAPSESPILGIPCSDFAYAEECRRVPHSFIAIKSDSADSDPLLKRLAEQVRVELEGEA
ncbi:MAG: hypothetical protein ACYDFT_02465 [Thermoplasmata archaeon]